jgi:DNA-binding phage protein
MRVLTAGTARAVFDSDEAIAEYMAVAFETEDAAVIADAVAWSPVPLRITLFDF